MARKMSRMGRVRVTLPIADREALGAALALLAAPYIRVATRRRVSEAIGEYIDDQTHCAASIVAQCREVASASAPSVAMSGHPEG